MVRQHFESDEHQRQHRLFISQNISTKADLALCESRVNFDLYSIFNNSCFCQSVLQKQVFMWNPYMKDICVNHIFEYQSASLISD